MLKLLILQEDKSYLVHELEHNEILIGRDLNNHVVLTSKRVSRRHASLTRSGETWILEDKESTQGTYLNGKRLESRQKVTLKQNDHLRFADIEGVLGNPEDPTFQIKTGDSIVELQKLAQKKYFSADFEDLRLFLENLHKAHLPEDKARALGGEVKSYIAELSDHVEEKFSELVTLLEVTKLVSPNLEIENFLNRAMKLGLEFFKAERGFMMIWDDKKNGLVLRATKNLANDQSRLKGTISDTITQRCIDKNELIIVADALIDPSFATVQSVVELAIRSILCIPLAHQDKKLGVYYLDHLTRTNVFKKSDMFLFRTFGEILSVNLRNTLKYEQALARVLL